MGSGEMVPRRPAALTRLGCRNERGPPRRTSTSWAVCVGLEAVQQVERPAGDVHDRTPVGGSVSGVETALGVPGEPRRARSPLAHRGAVDLAAVLVVGDETDALLAVGSDGPQRSDQAGRQVREDPLELAVAREVQPELGSGAAAVVLPPGRFHGGRGREQNTAVGTEGDVVEPAVRQSPARRPVDRNRMGEGALPLGLTCGADHQELGLREPSPYLRALLPPEGQPPGDPALGVGDIDLEGAVAVGRPGDLGGVRREPRRSGRSMVGADPIRAAAVPRGEPDVVLGNEDDAGRRGCAGSADMRQWSQRPTLLGAAACGRRTSGHIFVTSLPLDAARRQQARRDGRHSPPSTTAPGGTGRCLPRTAAMSHSAPSGRRASSHSRARSRRSSWRDRA